MDHDSDGEASVSVLGMYGPRPAQPITPDSFNPYLKEPPTAAKREIYLHMLSEEQRRAVESVERLVLGPRLDPSLVSAAAGSETMH